MGGLLNNARWVENFPGILPMTGKELIDQLKKSLQQPHIHLIFEEAVSIQPHTIQTKTGQTYKVDEVVVAMGTKPKIIQEWSSNPKIVYEWRDIPNGVHTVGILGAGDAAFDSGLSGLDRHYEVFIWNRSRQVKAILPLFQSYLQNGGHYFEEEPIETIQPLPTGLQIITGKQTKQVDILLVSIGRERETLSNFHPDRISFRMIGDYAHPDFRQASIAVGDGIRAGLELLQGVSSQPCKS